MKTPTEDALHILRFSLQKKSLIYSEINGNFFEEIILFFVRNFQETFKKLQNFIRFSFAENCQDTH